MFSSLFSPMSFPHVCLPFAQPVPIGTNQKQNFSSANTVLFSPSKVFSFFPLSVVNMNLLTRVMAAEEDHVEAALLDRLRLYNAALKHHGLPLMGQPDFRDEAQAQVLLDRLFLPCLPYGQLVADTKWSTGRLFGWFFLEESSNGGLAFLDFDGPLPPETQECETFFNAAATARGKESLFVVLAPLVFSRFVADNTEPQAALFMFRGRSLWHRLGQACTRHTHWPSARTELVLLTLLRFIRVLYEWQGGGSSTFYFLLLLLLFLLLSTTQATSPRRRWSN